MPEKMKLLGMGIVLLLLFGCIGAEQNEGDLSGANSYLNADRTYCQRHSDTCVFAAYMPGNFSNKYVTIFDGQGAFVVCEKPLNFPKDKVWNSSECLIDGLW